jgi:feruloyl esterase
METYRMTRLSRLLGFTAGAALLAAAAPAAAACEGISDLKIPHATITSVKAIEGGVFIEPPRPDRDPRRYEGLPAFCQVQGVSTPVPGSQIKFEVWLPQQGWTTRLKMFGNGAYNSTYYYRQMAYALREGNVVVVTDTGHTGGSLKFGVERPEAIADWGHRAVHESVVAAKQVVGAYYKRPPAFSYFAGCSTGGHQALQSIQRYPDDFDGVIAGAPGNNRTNLSLSFLWQFVNNHPPGDDKTQIIPDLKLRMVNRAVVKTCDPLDGLVDGVINDPRACRFDLASLRCPDAETDKCLTDAQIKAMKAIYQGPRDARTGRQIYPGYQFGQEGSQDGEEETATHPGWSHYWYDSEDRNVPNRIDMFRHWTFKDPNWSWWKFNWGSDVDVIDRVMAPIVNATNPDLSRYRARGGKVIMFMGWDDPVGAPMEAINYYDAVEARGKGATPAARRADTQTFARLYMVSGMAHCAGGDGATNFSTATRDSMPPVIDARHDMSKALEEWVEKGRAPEVLIATRYASNEGEPRPIAFQRPLCVYPKLPRYKGGDPKSAASFACALPKS